MTSLLERHQAVERTLGKFRGKAFAWGASDCVKMARTHLVNMGHKPPPLPCYRSAVGAKRALHKAGFEGLAGLFDSLLPRIAPATMLMGDLALLRGEEGLDSVMVSLGGKLAGWAEGADSMVVFVPREIIAAWRV